MSILSVPFYRPPQRKTSSKIPPTPPDLNSNAVSKERLGKIQDWLKRENLDGALFSNMKNIEYLTGFAPAGADPEEAFLLVTPGKVSLQTSQFYVEKAKRDAPHVQLSTDDLQTFLAKELPGAKQVAVEKENMTASRAEWIRATLPGVTLSDMDEAEKLRDTKTPAEVAALRKAIAITGEGIARVAAQAKPGVTEKELVATFKKTLVDHGAEEAFVTIIAAGPDGAEPHFDQPSDRPLKEGEPLVMDVGAKIDGYNADITRMIVLGKPSPDVQKILDLVAKAQEAAIAKIAPGVPVREVDLAARKVIEAAGYGKEFYHSVGHGVGKDVHEEPRVSWRTAPGELLKPGEVITAEPGVYQLGKFGVRIEDMILVTPQGHEVLSDYIPKVFHARGESLLDKMKDAWQRVTKRFCR